MEKVLESNTSMKKLEVPIRAIIGYLIAPMLTGSLQKALFGNNAATTAKGLLPSHWLGITGVDNNIERCSISSYRLIFFLQTIDVELENVRPRPQGSSPVYEYAINEYYINPEDTSIYTDSEFSSRIRKTSFIRTSHPFSKMSDSEEPMEITLSTEAKTGASGFNITGGREEGIIVSQVLKESPHSDIFCIKEGDQLLSATIYFDNITYEDALKILQQSEPYKVQFNLKRKLGKEDREKMHSIIQIKKDKQKQDNGDQLCSFKTTEGDKTVRKREHKKKRSKKDRLSWPKFQSIPSTGILGHRRSRSTSETNDEETQDTSSRVSELQEDISIKQYERESLGMELQCRKTISGEKISELENKKQAEPYQRLKEKRSLDSSTSVQIDQHSVPKTQLRKGDSLHSYISANTSKDKEDNTHNVIWRETFPEVIIVKEKTLPSPCKVSPLQRRDQTTILQSSTKVRIKELPQQTGLGQQFCDDVTSPTDEKMKSKQRKKKSKKAILGSTCTQADDISEVHSSSSHLKIDFQSSSSNDTEENKIPEDEKEEEKPESESKVQTDRLITHEATPMQEHWDVQGTGTEHSIRITTVQKTIISPESQIVDKTSPAQRYEIKREYKVEDINETFAPTEEELKPTKEMAEAATLDTGLSKRDVSLKVAEETVEKATETQDMQITEPKTQVLETVAESSLIETQLSTISTLEFGQPDQAAIPDSSDATPKPKEDIKRELEEREGETKSEYISTVAKETSSWGWGIQLPAFKIPLFGKSDKPADLIETEDASKPKEELKSETEIKEGETVIQSVSLSVETEPTTVPKEKVEVELQQADEKSKPDTDTVQSLEIPKELKEKEPEIVQKELIKEEETVIESLSLSLETEPTTVPKEKVKVELQQEEEKSKPDTDIVQSLEIPKEVKEKESEIVQKELSIHVEPSMEEHWEVQGKGKRRKKKVTKVEKTVKSTESQDIGVTSPTEEYVFTSQTKMQFELEDTGETLSPTEEELKPQKEMAETATVKTEPSETKVFLTMSEDRVDTAQITEPTTQILETVTQLAVCETQLPASTTEEGPQQAEDTQHDLEEKEREISSEYVSAAENQSASFGWGIQLPAFKIPLFGISEKPADLIDSADVSITKEEEKPESESKVQPDRLITHEATPMQEHWDVQGTGTEHSIRITTVQKTIISPESQIVDKTSPAQLYEIKREYKVEDMSETFAPTEEELKPTKEMAEAATLDTGLSKRDVSLKVAEETVEKATETQDTQITEPKTQVLETVAESSLSETQLSTISTLEFGQPDQAAIPDSSDATPKPKEDIKRELEERETKSEYISTVAKETSSWGWGIQLPAFKIPLFGKSDKPADLIETEDVSKPKEELKSETEIKEGETVIQSVSLSVETEPTTVPKEKVEVELQQADEKSKPDTDTVQSLEIPKELKEKEPQIVQKELIKEEETVIESLSLSLETEPTTVPKEKVKVELQQEKEKSKPDTDIVQSLEIPKEVKEKESEIVQKELRIHVEPSMEEHWEVQGKGKRRRKKVTKVEKTVKSTESQDVGVTSPTEEYVFTSQTKMQFELEDTGETLSPTEEELKPQKEMAETATVKTEPSETKVFLTMSEDRVDTAQITEPTTQILETVMQLAVCGTQLPASTTEEGPHQAEDTQLDLEEKEREISSEYVSAAEHQSASLGWGIQLPAFKIPLFGISEKTADLITKEEEKPESESKVQTDRLITHEATPMQEHWDVQGTGTEHSIRITTVQKTIISPESQIVDKTSPAQLYEIKREYKVEDISETFAPTEEELKPTKEMAEAATLDTGLRKRDVSLKVAEGPVEKATETQDTQITEPKTQVLETVAESSLSETQLSTISTLEFGQPDQAAIPDSSDATPQPKEDIKHELEEREGETKSEYISTVAKETSSWGWGIQLPAFKIPLFGKSDKPADLIETEDASKPKEELKSETEIKEEETVIESLSLSLETEPTTVPKEKVKVELQQEEEKSKPDTDIVQSLEIPKEVKEKESEIVQKELSTHVEPSMEEHWEVEGKGKRRRKKVTKVEKTVKSTESQDVGVTSPTEEYIFTSQTKMQFELEDTGETLSPTEEELKPQKEMAETATVKTEPSETKVFLTMSEDRVDTAQITEPTIQILETVTQLAVCETQLPASTTEEGPQQAEDTQLDLEEKEREISSEYVSAAENQSASLGWGIQLPAFKIPLFGISEKPADLIDSADVSITKEEEKPENESKVQTDRLITHEATPMQKHWDVHGTGTEHSIRITTVQKTIISPESQIVDKTSPAQLYEIKREYKVEDINETFAPTEKELKPTKEMAEAATLDTGLSKRDVSLKVAEETVEKATETQDMQITEPKTQVLETVAESSLSETQLSTISTLEFGQPDQAAIPDSSDATPKPKEDIKRELEEREGETKSVYISTVAKETSSWGWGIQLPAFKIPLFGKSDKPADLIETEDASKPKEELKSETEIKEGETVIQSVSLSVETEPTTVPKEKVEVELQQADEKSKPDTDTVQSLEIPKELKEKEPEIVQKELIKEEETVIESLSLSLETEPTTVPKEKVKVKLQQEEEKSKPYTDIVQSLEIPKEVKEKESEIVQKELSIHVEPSMEEHWEVQGKGKRRKKKVTKVEKTVKSTESQDVGVTSPKEEYIFTSQTKMQFELEDTGETLSPTEEELKPQKEMAETATVKTEPSETKVFLTMSEDRVDTAQITEPTIQILETVTQLAVCETQLPASTTEEGPQQAEDTQLDLEEKEREISSEYVSAAENQSASLGWGIQLPAFKIPLFGISEKPADLIDSADVSITKEEEKPENESKVQTDRLITHEATPMQEHWDVHGTGTEHSIRITTVQKTIISPESQIVDKTSPAQLYEIKREYKVEDINETFAPTEKELKPTKEMAEAATLDTGLSKRDVSLKVAEETVEKATETQDMQITEPKTQVLETVAESSLSETQLSTISTLEFGQPDQGAIPDSSDATPKPKEDIKRELEEREGETKSVYISTVAKETSSWGWGIQLPAFKIPLFGKSDKPADLIETEDASKPKEELKSETEIKEGETVIQSVSLSVETEPTTVPKEKVEVELQQADEKSKPDTDTVQSLEIPKELKEKEPEIVQKELIKEEETVIESLSLSLETEPTTVPKEKVKVKLQQEEEKSKPYTDIVQSLEIPKEVKEKESEIVQKELSIHVEPSMEEHWEVQGKGKRRKKKVTKVEKTVKSTESQDVGVTSPKEEYIFTSQTKMQFELEDTGETLSPTEEELKPQKEMAETATVKTEPSETKVFLTMSEDRVDTAQITEPTIQILETVTQLAVCETQLPASTTEEGPQQAEDTQLDLEEKEREISSEYVSAAENQSASLGWGIQLPAFKIPLFGISEKPADLIDSADVSITKEEEKPENESKVQTDRLITHEATPMQEHWDVHGTGTEHSIRITTVQKTIISPESQIVDKTSPAQLYEIKREYKVEDINETFAPTEKELKPTKEMAEAATLDTGLSKRDVSLKVAEETVEKATETQDMQITEPKTQVLETVAESSLSETQLSTISTLEFGQPDQAAIPDSSDATPKPKEDIKRELEEREGETKSVYISTVAKETSSWGWGIQLPAFKIPLFGKSDKPADLIETEDASKPKEELKSETEIKEGETVIQSVSLSVETEPTTVPKEKVEVELQQADEKSKPDTDTVQSLEIPKELKEKEPEIVQKELIKEEETVIESLSLSLETEPTTVPKEKVKVKLQQEEEKSKPYTDIVQSLEIPKEVKEKESEIVQKELSIHVEPSMEEHWEVQGKGKRRKKKVTKVEKTVKSTESQDVGVTSPKEEYVFTSQTKMQFELEDTGETLSPTEEELKPQKEMAETATVKTEPSETKVFLTMSEDRVDTAQITEPTTQILETVTQLAVCETQLPATTTEEGPQQAEDTQLDLEEKEREISSEYVSAAENQSASLGWGIQLPAFKIPLFGISQKPADLIDSAVVSITKEKEKPESESKVQPDRLITHEATPMQEHWDVQGTGTEHSIRITTVQKTIISPESQIVDKTSPAQIYEIKTEYKVEDISETFAPTEEELKPTKEMTEAATLDTGLSKRDVSLKVAEETVEKATETQDTQITEPKTQVLETVAESSLSKTQLSTFSTLEFGQPDQAAIPDSSDATPQPKEDIKRELEEREGETKSEYISTVAKETSSWGWGIQLPAFKIPLFGKSDKPADLIETEDASKPKEELKSETEIKEGETVIQSVSLSVENEPTTVPKEKVEVELKQADEKSKPDTDTVQSLEIPKELKEKEPEIVQKELIKEEETVIESLSLSLETEPTTVPKEKVKVELQQEKEKSKPDTDIVQSLEIPKEVKEKESEIVQKELSIHVEPSMEEHWEVQGKGKRRKKKVTKVEKTVKSTESQDVGVTSPKEEYVFTSQTKMQFELEDTGETLSPTEEELKPQKEMAETATVKTEPSETKVFLTMSEDRVDTAQITEPTTQILETVTQLAVCETQLPASTTEQGPQQAEDTQLDLEEKEREISSEYVSAAENQSASLGWGIQLPAFKIPLFGISEKPADLIDSADVSITKEEEKPENESKVQTDRLITHEATPMQEHWDVHGTGTEHSIRITTVQKTIISPESQIVDKTSPAQLYEIKREYKMEDINETFAPTEEELKPTKEMAEAATLDTGFSKRDVSLKVAEETVEKATETQDTQITEPKTQVLETVAESSLSETQLSTFSTLEFGQPDQAAIPDSSDATPQPKEDIKRELEERETKSEYISTVAKETSSWGWGIQLPAFKIPLFGKSDKPADLIETEDVSKPKQELKSETEIKEGETVIQSVSLSVETEPTTVPKEKIEVELQQADEKSKPDTDTVQSLEIPKELKEKEPEIVQKELIKEEETVIESLSLSLETEPTTVPKEKVKVELQQEKEKSKPDTDIVQSLEIPKEVKEKESEIVQKELRIHVEPSMEEHWEVQGKGKRRRKKVTKVEKTVKSTESQDVGVTSPTEEYVFTSQRKMQFELEDTGETLSPTEEELKPQKEMAETATVKTEPSETKVFLTMSEDRVDTAQITEPTTQILETVMQLAFCETQLPASTTEEGPQQAEDTQLDLEEKEREISSEYVSAAEHQSASLGWGIQLPAFKIPLFGISEKTADLITKEEEKPESESNVQTDRLITHEATPMQEHWDVQGTGTEHSIRITTVQKTIISPESQIVDKTSPAQLYEIKREYKVEDISETFAPTEEELKPTKEMAEAATLDTGLRKRDVSLKVAEETVEKATETQDMQITEPKTQVLEKVAESSLSETQLSTISTLEFGQPDQAAIPDSSNATPQPKEDIKCELEEREGETKSEYIGTVAKETSSWGWGIQLPAFKIPLFGKSDKPADLIETEDASKPKEELKSETEIKEGETVIQSVSLSVETEPTTVPKEKVEVELQQADEKSKPDTDTVQSLEIPKELKEKEPEIVQKELIKEEETVIESLSLSLETEPTTVPKEKVKVELQQEEEKSKPDTDIVQSLEIPKEVKEKESEIVQKELRIHVEPSMEEHWEVQGKGKRRRKKVTKVEKSVKSTESQDVGLTSPTEEYVFTSQRKMQFELEDTGETLSPTEEELKPQKEMAEIATVKSEPSETKVFLTMSEDRVDTAQITEPTTQILETVMQLAVCETQLPASTTEEGPQQAEDTQLDLEEKEREISSEYVSAAENQSASLGWGIQLPAFKIPLFGISEKPADLIDSAVVSITKEKEKPESESKVQPDRLITHEATPMQEHWDVQGTGTEHSIRITTVQKTIISPESQIVDKTSPAQIYEIKREYKVEDISETFAPTEEELKPTKEMTEAATLDTGLSKRDVSLKVAEETVEKATETQDMQITEPKTQVLETVAESSLSETQLSTFSTLEFGQPDQAAIPDSSDATPQPKEDIKRELEEREGETKSEYISTVAKETSSWGWGIQLPAFKIPLFGKSDKPADLIETEDASKPKEELKSETEIKEEETVIESLSLSLETEPTTVPKEKVKVELQQEEEKSKPDTDIVQSLEIPKEVKEKESEIVQKELSIHVEPSMEEHWEVHGKGKRRKKKVTKVEKTVKSTESQDVGVTSPKEEYVFTSQTKMQFELEDTGETLSPTEEELKPQKEMAETATVKTEPSETKVFLTMSEDRVDTAQITEPTTQILETVTQLAVCETQLPASTTEEGPQQAEDTQLDLEEKEREISSEYVSAAENQSASLGWGIQLPAFKIPLFGISEKPADLIDSAVVSITKEKEKPESESKVQPDRLITHEATPMQEHWDVQGTGTEHSIRITMVQKTIISPESQIVDKTSPAQIYEIKREYKVKDISETFAPTEEELKPTKEMTEAATLDTGLSKRDVSLKVAEETVEKATETQDTQITEPKTQVLETVAESSLSETQLSTFSTLEFGQPDQAAIPDSSNATPQPKEDIKRELEEREGETKSVYISTVAKETSSWGWGIQLPAFKIPLFGKSDKPADLIETEDASKPKEELKSETEIKEGETVIQSVSLSVETEPTTVPKEKVEVELQQADEKSKPDTDTVQSLEIPKELKENEPEIVQKELIKEEETVIESLSLSLETEPTTVPKEKVKVELQQEKEKSKPDTDIVQSLEIPKEVKEKESEIVQKELRIHVEPSMEEHWEVQGKGKRRRKKVTKVEKTVKSKESQDVGVTSPTEEYVFTSQTKMQFELEDTGETLSPTEEELKPQKEMAETATVKTEPSETKVFLSMSEDRVDTAQITEPTTQILETVMQLAVCETQLPASTTEEGPQQAEDTQLDLEEKEREISSEYVSAAENQSASLGWGIQLPAFKIPLFGISEKTEDLITKEEEKPESESKVQTDRLITHEATPMQEHWDVQGTGTEHSIRITTVQKTIISPESQIVDKTSPAQLYEIKREYKVEDISETFAPTEEELKPTKEMAEAATLDTGLRKRDVSLKVAEETVEKATETQDTQITEPKTQVLETVAESSLSETQLSTISTLEFGQPDQAAIPDSSDATPQPKEDIKHELEEREGETKSEYISTVAKETSSWGWGIQLPAFKIPLFGKSDKPADLIETEDASKPKEELKSETEIKEGETVIQSVSLSVETEPTTVPKEKVEVELQQADEKSKPDTDTVQSLEIPKNLKKKNLK
uniref:PDZ domain-containing protein n=2 Tax=Xenopus tropicalis TaxID=8364 RepID=A0A803K7H9_XENTR